MTKLASRKVLGHLRRISSLSHTSKNMVQEIGDQCLLILVINYLISYLQILFLFCLLYVLESN